MFQYGVLSSISSGPQIEVSLHSIFASRKRNPVADDEKQAQAVTAAILPSNFQVYAKIEEESRKDSRLVVSFLLTLNDARGAVTYEFRGICTIIGSTADFEAIMEAHKDSRIPKILDTIYQRLYPVVYLLAGMTTSSYPQSIALLTEMVSKDPIQVHQEAEAIPKPEEKPKIPEKLAMTTDKTAVAEKPVVVAAVEKPATTAVEKPAATAEVPKPTIARIKKPEGEKTTNPAKA